MTAFDARKLVGELEVTLDVDVLVGAYPDRDGPPGTPESVLGTLAGQRIRTGAIASLRAALFDMRSGNDEVLALASAHSLDGRHEPLVSPETAPTVTPSSPDASAAGPMAAITPAVVPVGTVDLRDPVGAVREIDRLVPLGVKAIRLFPDEQGVEAGFPSVRHVARKAAALGLVVLTGGDVRRFWQPFSGLDAKVVFLDTHFYHLGDFLVIAADEPGFHTSTRLLNSPDALETVPPDRLLYGSRTPHYEPVVPLLRLATSGLNPHEIAAVAGGNAKRLLG